MAELNKKRRIIRLKDIEKGLEALAGIQKEGMQIGIGKGEMISLKSWIIYLTKKIPVWK